MIVGDTFITNGASSGYGYSLKTGKSLGWGFYRQYGCNTALASENLLFFRSGCAAFFDLENLGGTGTFGGFKSGCTPCMIAAGGVLTIPDYTRGCGCGYYNKTSLALTYMPDVEFWTFGAYPAKEKSGINFGAPGDRHDQGILWLGSHNGRSTSIRAQTSTTLADNKQIVQYKGSTIKNWFGTGKGGRQFVEATATFDYPPLPEKPALLIDGGKEYCHHSQFFGTSELPWIASSGRVGVKSLRFGTLVEKGTGTLKLYFAEPDLKTKAGDRVFDVFVNDRKVLSDFDVFKESGAARKLIVKSFSAALKNPLTVRFVAKKGEALISGIELDTGMGVAVFNGNR